MPQKGPNENDYFDGKVGVWPFLTRIAAKRNSKNRTAGTLEFTPININADTFYEVMTRVKDESTVDGLDDGILETIKNKIPWFSDKKICLNIALAEIDSDDSNGDVEDLVENIGGNSDGEDLEEDIGRDGNDEDDYDDEDINEVSTLSILMDNAKPHIGKKNIDKLNEWGSSHGFEIKVDLQPPQSPDLNGLDLSIFRGLSKWAYKTKGSNTSQKLEDLFFQVTGTYEDYPSDIFSRVHAFMYEVYRLILKNYGGNDYQLPHTHIRKRQQDWGVDTADLYVEVSSVEDAEAWLLQDAEAWLLQDAEASILQDAEASLLQDD